jgi:RNA polymerase sigma factor (sigma-70 family)
MDGGRGDRGASFAPAASLEAVAVTYEQLSGRERTRRHIERIAAGDLGAKLRAQVAAWHPAASTDQLEEAFQEACLRAQRSCRGQREGEVYVWLRTTTHREVLHMERRARRRVKHERRVDASIRGVDPFATLESPEDELIRREDEAELEHMTRALLNRLSDRQRQVAALYSRGRRRPEIAAQLGLSQRSVKRALERIMAAGRAELVRLAGQGCDSGEALIARFAFGLAGPREMREAQQHLATCPRCGALYERLDSWREKVAAVLPMPVVEKAHPRLLDRALHTTADRLSALTHRGGGRETGLRERPYGTRRRRSAAKSLLSGTRVPFRVPLARRR